VHSLSDLGKVGSFPISCTTPGRLGNLINGPADIRNHPWFQEVVWEKLLAKDIETPYEPPITAGVGDSSLFDHYPEEQLDYGQIADDPYQEFFTDF
jgi:protein kinase A